MTKTLALSLALAGMFLSTAQAQTTAQPSAQSAAQSAAAPAQSTATDSRVAMCIGCHSIPGYQASLPQVYKVPKIAGQNAKYIAAALNAYKTGDRKHTTIRSIAETLTEQDIADIAAFYENLGKGDRKPAGENPSQEPDAKVAALVQKANCASCHGKNLSKPIDPSYPKLAGQHPDYLFHALKAYKTAESPAFGRSNGIMGAIAKQFSSTELKAIAQYVGSLDGEIETVPEPRFHQH
jgi:cytochrome c553